MMSGLFFIFFIFTGSLPISNRALWRTVVHISLSPRHGPTLSCSQVTSTFSIHSIFHVIERRIKVDDGKIFTIPHIVTFSISDADKPIQKFSHPAPAVDRRFWKVCEETVRFRRWNNMRSADGCDRHRSTRARDGRPHSPALPALRQPG